MVKAVFAGSFDPPTNGHLDIIKRASGLFESVDVVVSVNPEKHTMFSEEERVQFLQELIKPFGNVSVHSYKGIIVNYAKQVGAKVLVRGVRSANDFGYEFELALMNQNLNPEKENGTHGRHGLRVMPLFLRDCVKQIPQSRRNCIFE